MTSQSFSTTTSLQKNKNYLTTFSYQLKYRGITRIVGIMTICMAGQNQVMNPFLTAQDFVQKGNCKTKKRKPILCVNRTLT